MTRGERVIAFIHSYCLVPEGKSVGKPLRLMPFQERFIRDIYDNPAGTSRAYLSIARKNGKSALIAAIVLAHLVGPEARQNSQIISGARSRDQAALVYKLAEKMVRLSPRLSKLVKPTPSTKTLIGLPMNVEYRAISAEAGTAHGLSPVVAILDEVGQIKGPYDAFVEAIETSQGAHDAPLLVAISTQAATDADLFSLWLDDAATGADPRIVSHVYEADKECELMDKSQWAKANPALGVFLNEQVIADAATKADRMPSSENSFRWLHLNQRITAHSPFISRSVWAANGDEPAEFDGSVYGALDLSAVNDLTARVYVGKAKGKWAVRPMFWLPLDGLADRSRSDRVPYDLWHKQGHLEATPGKSIDYDFVAAQLYVDAQAMDIRRIAFDRWNMRHLRPRLIAAGFAPEQVEGDDALFVEFGQGFASISPALRTLEAALLETELAHGNHPVLTMCAANAVVTQDAAGNRKLDKSKATGRIDGMVALTMALSVAVTDQEKGNGPSVYEDRGLLMV